MSIETMRKRQSIRTYDTQAISDLDMEKIKDYIQNDDNFIGPFGNQGRIEMVQVTKNVTDKGIKLGTYGFIKNPGGYLVGLAETKTLSTSSHGSRVKYVSPLHY